jgi:two-component system KDP operon response regulator KdpE
MDDAAITIAVIDDEFAMRRLLQTSLEGRGYRIVTATSGAEGLQLIAATLPTLILLDLGLPDLDGLQVIAQLRSWTTIPIVILSARHEEIQKVAALDQGADDYLTKPFSMEELLARVRVAVRHRQQIMVPPIHLQTGAITLDRLNRTVQANGAPVHLTPTEYALVQFLMDNLGRVLTHGAILRAVWGAGYQHDTQLLRGFIAQVRQKLEPLPQRPIYLITEPGIGYRMRDLPSES